MSSSAWKFIFETDLNEVLQHKKLRGLVLHDLINSGRRLYVRKEEAADQAKAEDPEALLAELENV